MRIFYVIVQYAKLPGETAPAFAVDFNIGMGTWLSIRPNLNIIANGFTHGSKEELDVFLESGARSIYYGDFIKIDRAWYRLDRDGWVNTNAEEVTRASGVGHA